MRDLRDDDRSEYFQRKLDQPFIAALRQIDGTTPAPRGDPLSARQRILATASHVGGTPVVGGIAASILYGNPWFDPDFRIELLRAPSASNKQSDGKTAHRYMLARNDVIELEGVLVTTPVRTAFDIGRVTPEWRGLGNLDALSRATAFSIPDLARYVDTHGGWRYIRQLRTLVPLIDGRAESPRESALRLLIIRGELPIPELQIVVADEAGTEFARIDMGYPDQKIGIEYDGEEFHSREWQRKRDAHRDKLLTELGWNMIHVDADRMRDSPTGILVEIESALHDRRHY
jgi:hypothetical protein